MIDKLTNENKVMLSIEMPMLNEQNYYSNCSIAITSKLLVEEAINFFKANLVTKVEEPAPTIPTWSVPTMEVNEPVASAPAEPVVAPITSVPITPNPQVSAEQIFNTSPQAPTQPVPNITPVMPSNSTVNEPNPQAEKLAVVSDPSLNNAGLNLQPNVARKGSAGNANTKYIIIGTICLVLAITVVVVAYFLIKNMK